MPADAGYIAQQGAASVVGTVLNSVDGDAWYGVQDILGRVKSDAVNNLGANDTDFAVVDMLQQSYSLADAVSMLLPPAEAVPNEVASGFLNFVRDAVDQAQSGDYQPLDFGGDDDMYGDYPYDGHYDDYPYGGYDDYPMPDYDYGYGLIEPSMTAGEPTFVGCFKDVNLWATNINYLVYNPQDE